MHYEWYKGKGPLQEMGWKIELELERRECQLIPRLEQKIYERYLLGQAQGRILYLFCVSLYHIMSLIPLILYLDHTKYYNWPIKPILL